MLNREGEPVKDTTKSGSSEVLPPDVEPQINAVRDLELGLKEMKKSLPYYEKAEAYFLGDVEEKYMSKHLRRMLTGSETDFYVNLAGRVVSAVTDRLEIAAITANDDEFQSKPSTETDPTVRKNTPPADESATQALNERVWHYNELDIEAPEVHQKATYFGDSYLFVWPTADDEDGVDVFFNSPKTTRVFYDIENPRKKKFGIKKWVEDSGHHRVNLYYEDWIVKYVSKTAKSKGENARDFRPYFEDPEVDVDGVVENPFGKIPIFHFRTARPYGIPEHFGAYGPQDAITKLIRAQMTLTDFAAFPQRWALGETGAGSDDDLDWGDDDDAVGPQDLASQYVSGPGRVWVLKNTAAVGQFQEANVDQILKPLDKFIELMAATTGTPLSYLHKVRGTSSTPLSGESQKQTEVMLLKKIAARQRSYESTWRESMNFALEILGFENSTVSIQWAAVIQSNDKQTWDSVNSQQLAGVPKRQTLLEQGYTVAQVEEWGYTEEEPNGPPELAEQDPFVAAQHAPVRPELKDNIGKTPDQLHAEKEKSGVTSEEATAAKQ